MLLYAPVVAKNAETENLRVRVTPELKESLDEFAERKKTTQQATVNGVLAWFFEQEGLLQSMILGQVEPEYHAEIIDKVLGSLRGATEAGDHPPDQDMPGGRGSSPRTPPPGRSPAGSSPVVPPATKVARGRSGRREPGDR